MNRHEGPQVKSRSTGRKSLRDLQKEETLSLLIKSAKHLFLRKGYARTTIDEIASRAGASRATFYLHFSKKWLVLRYILEASVIPEGLEFYRRLDDMGVPSKADLRTWLIEALEFFERHKKILAVVREAQSVEPELGFLNLEFLRACVDAMPNYLSRWGAERQSYAKLRMNMLTAQLDDAATWVVHNSSEMDKELVVQALLEYWTIGLQLPPKAR